jgi:hypothetical protein
MRKCLALGLAGILLSSPAFAYLAPPTAPPPGCETCPSSCIGETYSYYNPGYVQNAERGDLFYLANPKGVMGMMVLGAMWTHVGVMLNMYNIRHNSMDLEGGHTTLWKNFLALTLGWLSDKNADYAKGDQSSGAGDRYWNGQPGLHSSSIETSFDFGAVAVPTPADTNNPIDQCKWDFPDTVQSYAWSAAGSQALQKPVSTYRTQATAVANWMEAKTGYPYHVYAFYFTDRSNQYNGNGCSGTIASATRSQSTVLDIATPAQPTAILSLALLNARALLYDGRVRNKVSCMSHGTSLSSTQNDAIG